jgi:hypothetical protein
MSPARVAYRPLLVPSQEMNFHVATTEGIELSVTPVVAKKLIRRPGLPPSQERPVVVTVYGAVLG